MAIHLMTMTGLRVQPQVLPPVLTGAAQPEQFIAPRHAVLPFLDSPTTRQPDRKST